jgi:hypothetical protein
VSVQQPLDQTGPGPGHAHDEHGLLGCEGERLHLIHRTRVPRRPDLVHQRVERVRVKPVRAAPEPIDKLELGEGLVVLPGFLQELGVDQTQASVVEPTPARFEDSARGVDPGGYPALPQTDLKVNLDRGRVERAALHRRRD